MTKRSVSWGLLIAAVLSSGCLSHVPRVPVVSSSAYQGITWRTDLDAARAEAAREGRPLLVIAVAGALEGPC